MRTFLSTALIVLLVVLVPLSAIAAWSDLEIGDSDHFVSTMAPLASDTAVQNSVTERVTEAVMTRIDAGPLQERVRDVVRANVRSFTTTETFRSTWKGVSRAAHATVERALRNGEGDAVTIDLAPVAAQVKAQLVADGVPFADRISAVQHTTITLLEPDRLGTWRHVVRGLRTAGIWPAVGSLLLAAAAVLLAVRRRRALIGGGLAFAAGGVLLGILVMACRGLLLDGLSSVDRPAGGAVYDALTASLRTTAWAVFAIGSALAATAWVTGLKGFPGPLGRVIRRLRRPRPATDRP